MQIHILSCHLNLLPGTLTALMVWNATTNENISILEKVLLLKMSFLYIISLFHVYWQRNNIEFILITLRQKDKQK